MGLPPIREHRRAAVCLAVRVRHPSGDETSDVLYTEDISLGGLYVRTPLPARVGETLTLDIDLPQATAPLPVEAEVRHVITDGTAAKPAGMGLMFRAPRPELLASVDELVAIDTIGPAEVQPPPSLASRLAEIKGLLDTERYEQARMLCRTLVGRHPEVRPFHVEFHLSSGLLALRLGRLDEARRQLGEALSLDHACMRAIDALRELPEVADALPTRARRRRHPRVVVMLDATVVDGAGSSEALVRNLSRGGMYVCTIHPAEVGRVVTVGFHLPPTGQEVVVHGRVARQVTPDVARQTGEAAGMAVEFIGLPPEIRQAIGDLIERRIASLRKG